LDVKGSSWTHAHKESFFVFVIFHVGDIQHISDAQHTSFTERGLKLNPHYIVGYGSLARPDLMTDCRRSGLHKAFICKGNI